MIESVVRAISNPEDSHRVSEGMSGISGIFRATKRLFFPAAGNGNGTNLNNAGDYGNYWSSTLNTDNTDNAYNLNFNSSNVNPENNNNRYNGFSVRPVSASIG